MLTRSPTLTACRWISDELGINAYCRMIHLRRLPMASYDRRWDIWTLDPEALSEGCAGPEMPVEIMV